MNTTVKTVKPSLPVYDDLPVGCAYQFAGKICIKSDFDADTDLSTGKAMQPPIDGAQVQPLFCLGFSDKEVASEAELRELVRPADNPVQPAAEVKPPQPAPEACLLMALGDIVRANTLPTWVRIVTADYDGGVYGYRDLPTRSVRKWEPRLSSAESDLVPLGSISDRFALEAWHSVAYLVGGANA